ncbi:MAG: GNAT family N-acetyltransferase [Candidatus Methanoperedens sp.]|nr:GNAT family N-acetyltransferase [Candidatus Methanoperedens sp.]
MDFEYDEKVSTSKWEEIIRNSENSYFFHTPAWAKILEETYSYRIATRLYEIDGNEVLIPMMEDKKYGFYHYNSIPLGYGGIFSLSDISSETLQKILKNIVDWRHLSFNLSLPPFSNFSVPEDSLIKQVNSEWNYTHMLSLENGFEYIWKNKFEKNTRTAIRKADRSGFEILDCNSLDEVREFYKLYIESSIRWGYKKPPLPIKLYENIYKFGRPHVRIKLAFKDDNLIAGWGDHYYGKNVFAFLSVYSQGYERYNPVNLLVKDSIEQACNEGHKYYNFGASGNLEGVQKFKESFGAEKEKLKNYRVLSRLGKFADMILKI